MIITRSSSWIKPERRLAIYMRDHFQCVACGVDMEDMDPNMVTLDHVLSKHTYSKLTPAEQLAFGSVNKTSNLVSCCKPCNSSKQDRDVYSTMGAMKRVQYATRQPINIKLAKQLVYG